MTTSSKSADRTGNLRDENHAICRQSRADLRAAPAFPALGSWPSRRANPFQIIDECSHAATIVSEPDDGTGPFAGLSERMMGLEPTTFCMAKAGGRSRPFARVR